MHKKSLKHKKIRNTKSFKTSEDKRRKEANLPRKNKGLNKGL